MLPQHKRLKTGRGPNTFDTSTRAKLLIIVRRLLAIAVLNLKLVSIYLK